MAQLYASDIPDLPRPEGTDLLQVLWCAYDHDEDCLPRTKLRWRTSSDIVDALRTPPRPAVIGDDSYLPEPCVLHPEPVTEYPAPHELPAELVERIEQEWSGAIDYQYDLGVAPGCKVGGYGPWSFSNPSPTSCTECSSAVRPLLTLDGCEWDGGSGSWRPLEDADYTGYHSDGPACATKLNIGRGYTMQLYVCTTSVTHPHIQNMQ